ncbi:hypothetical protein [Anthocerotibacter panamensis]|uniref:hypothetical protein n=1 Tax=Anthocerotibacter panamensis TaxID=2857077 RepID=UPI001C4060EA|nr:hypothetical protein [Anthocerotibacter panamensis]
MATTRRLKKALLVALPLTLMTPLLTQPVFSASCSPIDFTCYLTQALGYLGIGNIGDYYTQLNTYLMGTAVPQEQSAVESTLTNAINSSTYSLSVVDPIGAGNMFMGQPLDPAAMDPNNPNSLLRKTRETRELNRQLTRSAITSVMGMMGQEDTMQQITDTQGLIAEIASYVTDPSFDDLYDRSDNTFSQVNVAVAAGQEVENLDIQANAATATQDVLKRIASQNTQLSKQFSAIATQNNDVSVQMAYLGQQLSYQASILGAMRVDNLYARQDAQLTNLNLSDISSLLEEQNAMVRGETLNEGLAHASAAVFADPAMTKFP